MIQSQAQFNTHARIELIFQSHCHVLLIPQRSGHTAAAASSDQVLNHSFFVSRRASRDLQLDQFDLLPGCHWSISMHNGFHDGIQCKASLANINS